MESSGFWIAELDLNELLLEIRDGEGKDSSFWNVFNDYEPRSIEEERPDRSPEWVGKEKVLVQEIESKFFSGKDLLRDDISHVIDAVHEVSLPEDEQDLELVESDSLSLAQEIYGEFFEDLEITEATLVQTLERLEDRLLNLNMEHIFGDETEKTKKVIKEMVDSGQYSSEQGDEILRSYEIETFQSLGQDEEEYEEELAPEDLDDFEFPGLCLAYSDTFFGDDDLGHLSYEERDREALEKFDFYVSSISKLLNIDPDFELQPLAVSWNEGSFTDEQAETYYGFLESNPFCSNFDWRFVAWRGEDKILFLSLSQEDKELPIEIDLGGLARDKYLSVLEAYNEMVKSLSLDAGD